MTNSLTSVLPCSLTSGTPRRMASIGAFGRGGSWCNGQSKLGLLGPPREPKSYGPIFQGPDATSFNCPGRLCGFGECH